MKCKVHTQVFTCVAVAVCRLWD